MNGKTVRKPLTIIKAGEIKTYYTMQMAIDAMHRAFTLLSSGESFVPARFVTRFIPEKLLMLFKPASVERDKRISVKILTQRENSGPTDIPVIQGLVMVVDSDTGEILSIMDGEYLTALRTGAASGLATRFFARENAEVMALFGCGAQGATQLEAVICARQIKKVFVFDQNRNLALQFITRMREKLNVELVYSGNTSVLAETDIICTATNSTKPLFKREEVKKGVHINAIGSFQPHMQELDPLLIKGAKVYVDQLVSCLKESGDLIKPVLEGIISESHITGEIGDYCLKKIPGRESDEEITIFKSVGVAIQDYAVALDIYHMAIEKGFGQEINIFE